MEPRIPVIDLFAGPGGLGEGFAALHENGAGRPFRIHLSIEKDPSAHATLRLRSFYRQFRAASAPEKYYDLLRGAATVDELFAAHPKQAVAADCEAWCATLGETPRSLINQRIRKAVGSSNNWVLVGGPPCQAYSLAGRSRNHGIKDYIPEADNRQYLYVEYLQVIADHWPAVFVMENVKGLLSASVNNRRILQRIIEDLQSPAAALTRGGRRLESTKRHHSYRIVPVTSSSRSGDDYIVAAEKHGVPQKRHRLILIGIRDDLGVSGANPLLDLPEVPVRNVLAGLPRLRSGLSSRDGEQRWLDVVASSLDKRWLSSADRASGPGFGEFVTRVVSGLSAPKFGRGAPFIEGDFPPEYRPEWFVDSRLGGVCLHQTRGHLDADLHRYLFVASFGRIHGRSPTLREFPADLLPAHESVGEAIETGGHFNDRFRVQLWNKPATTVMSHIAKDGHYYIHPDVSQCRSLTLREAARLQTFPDNYFFTGPRTKGFSQVGNAVPPLLAKRIAGRVWNVLRSSGLID